MVLGMAMPMLGAGADVVFNWQTVVNNGVVVPGDSRKFNSYNQPSMNMNRFVVFRARSKGGLGGEPAHGIFTRDMNTLSPLSTVFDRNALVPLPNNLSSTFTEPPSFPRIDVSYPVVVSRGNHQPVWEYIPAGETEETRAGTTGIYTNGFGSLITAASNLGSVPDFSFFAVPGTAGIKFDVFPGTPSVTIHPTGNAAMRVATIVFKGNYTENGVGKTGVYFRDLTDDPIELSDGSVLSPAGGEDSVVVIANTATRIPGTKVTFGSTAPPSAANGWAVFTGLDNEDFPTQGGIYLVHLIKPNPPMTVLVRIGDQVPGEAKGVGFNRLGEALSFDGRFVAFWGAWGNDTKTLILQCPTAGNKIRNAYCNAIHPSGALATVPLHQGIFVYDTVQRSLTAMAKAPNDYDDFVYWNFTGFVQGMGESGGSGETDDTGEPARWRSATFLAVSGVGVGGPKAVTHLAAFKARKGAISNGAYVNPVDGVYLGGGPGTFPLTTVIQTGMDGKLIDPAMPLSLPVTELGLERDGFRNNAIVISVGMGVEEAGWAGIYLTTIPSALIR